MIEHERVIKKLSELTFEENFKIKYVLFHLVVDAIMKIDSQNMKLKKLRKFASFIFEIINVNFFEFLDSILEAMRTLKVNQLIHHRHLNEETLTSLMRSNDEKRLEILMQIELEQIAAKKSKVTKLKIELKKLFKANI